MAVGYAEDWEDAVKLPIVAALVLGAYAPVLAQTPSPSESVVVARGEASVKRWRTSAPRATRDPQHDRLDHDRCGRGRLPALRAGAEPTETDEGAARASGASGSYPVSDRAIVPKESECTNLVVPVCLSSSHMAYGSIRMEPVFMLLGQSAATAAVQAIEANVSVQRVDYPKLRARLLADKQKLTWP